MLMICVDCDLTINGPYIIAAPGDSMSGARPDAYVHPPRSTPCRPPDPRKRELRRRLDQLAEARPSPTGA
ncbi:nuclear transport factor 2 family protein [Streptomyces sp. NPDC087901]|uniref:nuclear transport factor 2 family protein n=1 Tax=unclassified Streptomyces TaxID=2593676 RepID=UPI00342CF010